MIIKIRFYDDSMVLNSKFGICKKLQERISEANNYGHTFLIEFYCISNNTLKKCMVEDGEVIFSDIDILTHYNVNNNEFYYIIVDLDWKSYSNIQEEILNKYNIESNSNKVKMLLYTHAANYSELIDNYERMRAQYSFIQFFKAPTMLNHTELFVNKWCDNAANILNNID